MKEALTMSRPWWKEPMVWLIAGLPAAAVVASFATYFIAASNPDPLVKAGYHKEGMAPDKDTTLEDRAHALGLNGQLAMQADGTITLSLASPIAELTGNLRLSLIHPTHVEQDINVLLVRTDQNQYIGPVVDMDNGRRQVIIEPEDLSWRLSGHWPAPFDGSLELGGAR